MKIFKPLVGFLIGLMILSVVAGLLFPTIISLLEYSSFLYLLVCFGTAAHFLEEDFTKAWEVESEIRETSLYGKPFFVMFSHTIVLLSFLFYFPIAAGVPWAMIYGLGVTLNGIGNGIVHLGILVRYRKNTGVFSGIFLLIVGLLLLVSLFI
ncbi:MAG: HXXEE domain-containing protein [Candidatus Lokiarchaeota archaeon]|nr:HXXEE domain-containing protein [Candidatus Lokiarchaeota archaeon]